MILKSNTFQDQQVVDEKYTLYGANIFPHLAWSDIPAQTKSFALVCHDKDAPVASGFWHLQLVNIPLGVTELPEGTKDFPGFMRNNDMDEATYIGPRPPKGAGKHEYKFTIYALPYEDIAEVIKQNNRGEHTVSSSRAIVGFFLNMTALDKASISMFFEKK